MLMTFQHHIADIAYPKNPFVCPKKGIGLPTFLFFSDGIGTRKFLFDREGSGFLGLDKLHHFRRHFCFAFGFVGSIKVCGQDIKQVESS